MLKHSNLVAFSATANAEKSEKFYEDVLGLTKVENTPFAIVFETNGVTLRIQKVDSVAPLSYTALGWEVDDIVSTVKALVAKGVSFEQFESLPQDDLGIWTTPDGVKVAWFKDPDKNTLSITQNHSGSVD